MTLPLFLWHALTRAGAPLLRYGLARRARRGKECPVRLPERFGVPDDSVPALCRPQVQLLWCHGASVGESLSALPLLHQFLATHPDWHVLMTTGTVTSARLLAERLPERAVHQFVPVDHPRWVAAFLAAWQPDAGVWLESDLWPNLLLTAQRRGIPLLLANARLSATSFRRWQRLPRTAHRLLGCFQQILAQDVTQSHRFATLSGQPVTAPGNLKDDAPPLPCDTEALTAMQVALAGRPVWLAASTHPGEDAQVLAAHQRLREQFPALLLIIVPRHPHRGSEIATLAAGMGFATDGTDSVVCRSTGVQPVSGTAVYIADTMGELGLFYRLASIAFVGGSLIPHGGQNILEPALLDTAILHGPHLFNFADILETFTAAGGSLTVQNAAELAETVTLLLTDQAQRDRLARAAHAAVNSRQGATAATLRAVAALVATHAGTQKR
jgi:3-deoxy-D-manno-octulosonic-acid transferase